MILATEINMVINIIDVDKTSRRVHLTKIKPELDRNQQIQSEIYLHRKNNHYSAMAVQKENHISPERLKSGMRIQIRLYTDVNQIPIKSNKNVVTTFSSNTLMSKA